MKLCMQQNDTMFCKLYWCCYIYFLQGECNLQNGNTLGYKTILCKSCSSQYDFIYIIFIEIQTPFHLKNGER